LPTLASSPSSLQFRLWSQMTSMMIGRPEFTDLRALVTKHIDFDALPELIDAQSPALLLGAGDVLEGTFKIFTSAASEISPEAVLASAAIPGLFPAVWVDGHAYWDGIFASNPPVLSFLRERVVGKGNVPEEIWILQVNRSKHDDVPETPSDISDRRNNLAGNLSLRHELQLIEMVNLLLQEGALTPAFRARFGFDTTERIAVRFIRMSKELQDGLDHPSKLSRLPEHIDRLLADGEAQANAFLAELDGIHFPPLVPSVGGDADGGRIHAGRPA
jgi:NTE family protein